jgi:DNA-binding response OmpR family regulator
MTANPTTKANPAWKQTRDASCPATTTEAVKKKILVLDDDPQIRESLRKVLRAEGYEVALAANARQGIETFEAERIDLLLLDLNLPDQSGWDVFGLLTALNPFVPIIIITGRNEQYELAAGAGVGALIEKPLNVPRLLETVKTLLAQPPVVHLKRMAGQISDVQYVPPPRRPPGTKRGTTKADST